MKAKKNPEISIEHKKGMFFQIGLIVTLLLVLIAFEWKSYEKTDYSLGQLQMVDLEDEMNPITRLEETPPPPPPPVLGVPFSGVIDPFPPPPSPPSFTVPL